MRAMRFLLVLLLFSIACNSDEEQNPVYKGIIGKSFLLSYYDDGINLREDLLFTRFTFNSDKTLEVYKYGEFFYGTWDVYEERDYNYFNVLTILELNFPENSELQTFNKPWMVSLGNSNDLGLYFSTATLMLIQEP
jgi:hypothetical protein